LSEDLEKPGVDPIVTEAHRETRRAMDYEREARANWLSDEKFANGDAYNNWQWPTAISATRKNRPTLTVNEVRQHNLHITNEAKQNKSSVKYRPVGDGATAEAAEVMEGIYRHISNISNAQMAQGQAIDFQVRAGLGFTVVRSDYVDQKSFDQEIYIDGIDNPLGCYLFGATKPDGADAWGGVIFADVNRDALEREYPQLKGRAPAANAVDGQDAGWLREDTVRKAEYYKIVEKKDELIGNDDGITILKSATTPALLEKWEADAQNSGSKLMRRPVVTKRVKCYTIVGDMVVDETDIPGTSIPIVPWCGEITLIDGKLDRKGHTRAMIGAQQMVNYNWSASVEFGALQSKSPWIAPAAAIEGYETYWQTANTVNHSILPYNHIDDAGKEIPPPKRQEPPVGAPVFLEGMKTASEFMMAASGQYQADLGKEGNEKSGKAINERQRQSERATYHFTDNQALAIRRQGEIVKEWIPIIYDTKRVIKILGLDGEESHVQIDPESAEAHMFDGAVRIFNPGVGRYEVVSDPGPDYATQRQEAFNAIVQILTQAPGLIEKIGDLLFKVADFPMADEIAERLKPGMDPAAQQAIGELQKQLKNQNRLLGEAMQALSEERLKTKGKDAEDNVKAFDADTRRLAVVKDMLPLDPTAMHAMIHETVRQALQDNLGPIIGNLRGALAQDANPAGTDTGGSGQLPISVPDVGQQAAEVGGGNV
jgi:Phage P22-like portal protein